MGKFEITINLTEINSTYTLISNHQCPLNIFSTSNLLKTLVFMHVSENC